VLKVVVIVEILPVVIRVMVRAEEEIGEGMTLVVEVTKVDLLPEEEQGMKQILDGSMSQVGEGEVVAMVVLLLPVVVLVGDLEVRMEEAVVLMEEAVGATEVEGVDMATDQRQTTLDFMEMIAQIEDWKTNFSTQEMGKVLELISTRFFFFLFLCPI
jgi:hypothetical protein